LDATQFLVDDVDLAKAVRCGDEAGGTGGACQQPADQP